MVGSSREEVKLLGPLQLYEPAGTVAVVKLNVCPVQTGLLLPGTGGGGAAFTTTLVVAVGPVHPLTVAFTEYVPASEEVTPEITGFCAVEEKLFGPVQL